MAAGNTYTPIATTTLASVSSVITFSSIPSTYTDLVLIAYFSKTATNSTTPSLTVNNDTGANYGQHTFGWVNGGVWTGTASSGSSITPSTGGYVPVGTTYWCNYQIDFMNYKNTTTNKVILVRNNNPDADTYGSGPGRQIGSWKSTAAINRIDFTVSSSTFVVGSTFTLYGITAA